MYIARKVSLGSSEQFRLSEQPINLSAQRCSDNRGRTVFQCRTCLTACDKGKEHGGGGGGGVASQTHLKCVVFRKSANL